MKKKLFVMLLGLCTLTATATPEESSDQVMPLSGNSNVGMLDVLNQVQGYVFLSSGESRSLASLFEGSDVFDLTQQEIDDLQWSSAKPEVAEIHSENGLLTANSFGNTLVTAKNPVLGHEFHVVVFVCPTVTVKSPEGAVYSYQKIYDYPAKINFSKSKDYMLNCVMLKIGANDPIDITEAVNYDRDENGNIVQNSDGYYNSDPIKQNITFTVSMEKRIPKNEEGDSDVVGASGINIRVSGHRAEFVKFDEETGEPVLDFFKERKVTITDIYNRTVYDQIMHEDNVINFLNGAEGVFFVTIQGVPGDFKIIID